jgi:hypothetical protein
MTLLRNKRQWRKWAKVFHGGQPQVAPPKEPTEFPCFVYETVQSFGYEECNEHYLYRADLKAMLEELEP